uniref:Uncharacterized protein n=1 Tax=Rhizophora mucronata TaxID=61149 RepID=A0A2P2PCW1_RHIMU
MATLSMDSREMWTSIKRHPNTEKFPYVGSTLPLFELRNSNFQVKINSLTG